jgi:copper homeostasis protein
VRDSQSVLVEIVVCSVEDAVAAEQGGAGRLELCVALEVGGLTPSLGLLEAVKARVQIPVMAMVRPRPGGFHYSPDEIAVMERDANVLVQQGADGIVFGALRADGTVNTEAFARLIAAGQGAETVCHRAFDGTPNPFAALDAIAALGLTRILTSGGAKNALDGAETLVRLVSHAAERLEIMPGGGIRAHNAAEIVHRTRCRSLHLAPMTPRTDASSLLRPDLGYGHYSGIEAERVAEVVRAVA